MIPHGFREHLGRGLMIQLGVAALLALVLGVLFREQIAMIYFSNQQTALGLALNGLIFLLFALGMMQVVGLLLRYRNEEQAVVQLAANLDDRRRELHDGMSDDSIIAMRLNTLEDMHRRHAEIDHHALAATLVASESTRNAMARFIQNILILCGVLGTIISLSLALFGASSLLGDDINSGGMGLVIHGMSTALSTTMTAILCYLFFAWFHNGVQNVQTNVIAGVEQLTVTHLLPMFRITSESISREAVALMEQLNALAASLQAQAGEFDVSAVAGAIETAGAQQDTRQQELLVAIGGLEQVMRNGFRLPEERDGSTPEGMQ